MLLQFIQSLYLHLSQWKLSRPGERNCQGQHTALIFILMPYANNFLLKLWGDGGFVSCQDLNRLQQRNAELEKQLQLEREEAPMGAAWS